MRRIGCPPHSPRTHSSALNANILCVEKIRKKPSPPVPDRGWRSCFCQSFQQIILKNVCQNPTPPLADMGWGTPSPERILKRLLIMGQGDHLLSATGGVGFRLTNMYKKVRKNPNPPVPEGGSRSCFCES